MSNMKKIIISLPDNLLMQTDHIAQQNNRNRSELIREALAFYMAELNKKRIREELMNGYKEMGELNLKLSEEGMGESLLDLKEYETILI